MEHKYLTIESERPKQPGFVSSTNLERSLQILRFIFSLTTFIAVSGTCIVSEQAHLVWKPYQRWCFPVSCLRMTIDRPLASSVSLGCSLKAAILSSWSSSGYDTRRSFMRRSYFAVLGSSPIFQPEPELQKLKNVVRTFTLDKEIGSNSSQRQLLSGEVLPLFSAELAVSHIGIRCLLVQLDLFFAQIRFRELCTKSARCLKTEVSQVLDIPSRNPRKTDTLCDEN